jgi:hypothetical protein
MLAYDPNIQSDSLVRKKKLLQFNEKGKYIQQGDLLRDYQAKKRFQNNKYQKPNKNKPITSTTEEEEKGEKDQIGTEEKEEKTNNDQETINPYDIKQKMEESKKSLIGEIQMRIGLNDIPEVKII